jgi:magnesium-transporting ATPase (P-type)
MVVGMTQMHKRRVVIRQLSALEALGGVTNICSDKTGTLTQGQMVTRKAWVPGVGIYSVNKSDDASDPSRGYVSLNCTSSDKAKDDKQNEKTQTSSADSQDDKAITEVNPELERFLLASSLCNLATVRYDSTAGKWHTMGDPTEIALQVFAHRFGYGKKTLEADLKWKQIAEYPFDSAIKRMSVIYSKGTDGPVIFVKGAVERIIDLCTSVGTGSHEESMTADLKANILQQMKSLADQGLRVLAIAQRPVPVGYQKGDELAREDVEAELNLLGLAGLYDPPRLETKDAIKGNPPLYSHWFLVTFLLTSQRMHKCRHPCPHVDRRSSIHSKRNCKRSRHHPQVQRIPFS